MATLNQFTLRRTSPRPSLLQPDPAPVPDARRVPVVPLDVLVCTPDIASETTQRFLASLRDTTSHIAYDLHVHDNRGRKPFVHATALNRALDAAQAAGHNLLICDDDITFDDPQWLDKALDHAEALDNDFGAMGFNLYFPGHAKWATAVWNIPNIGSLVLSSQTYKAPVCIPMQCSACLLIAPTSIRFNPEYKKYRVELEWFLTMWESGKRSYHIPANIHHDCGGQFKAIYPDATERQKIYGPDEVLYRERWIKTGREEKILKEIAKYMPPEIANHPHYPKDKSKQIMTIARTERRALVTVAVGEKYKYTHDLMRRYARKIGADFICIDELWIRNEPTAHFLKWKCNAVVAMGYDRILYVDSDIIIMPNSPDIFNAVPAGMLGVYDEAPLTKGSKWDGQGRWNGFVGEWNRRHPESKITTPYPGHYWNSGVIVFDEKTNPFAARGGAYEHIDFGDSLYDQTYLNVFNERLPVASLDWKFNTMAIDAAKNYIGHRDMIDSGGYFLHYCGTHGEQDALPGDLARVSPPPVERLPGPSADGLRDFWLWCGRDGAPVSIFEDGSAHGESLEIALSIYPDMNAVCADPWNTPRYGSQAKADFDTRHGWNKNVRAVQGYTVDVLKTIPDKSLDVAYLDSIHEYGPLKAHIEAVLPKIKEGGIVAGHDYNKILWPGVIKAVNEAFLGPCMVFADTSWGVVVK